MNLQEIEAHLGGPRFDAFFRAADFDVSRAVRLYRWNAELSAEVHKHIAYFEVILRNAIDRGLSQWNPSQSVEGQEFDAAWTISGGAGSALYRSIGRKIAEARESAQRESRNRPIDHPRHAVVPTHDDVLAQLMFGTWTQLINGLGRAPAPQTQLWEESLGAVFSGNRFYRRRSSH